MPPYTSNSHVHGSLGCRPLVCALFFTAIPFLRPVTTVALSERVLPATEAEVWYDGSPEEDARARSKAYREAHPEWQAVFDRFTKDLEAFFDRYPGGTPLPPGQATALIDELYHDSGNDRLNWRWQDLVLDRIRGAALNPEISLESMEILRSGLIEYQKLGGGSTGPVLRWNLGIVFCAVSDESHPELERTGQTLVEQARNEAEQTEQARRFVACDIGGLDYVYSRLEQLGRIKPGASEFQKWAACEGTLQQLEQQEKPDAGLIERAAAAVAACGASTAAKQPRGPGRPAEPDPLERLLIAYRKIAERNPGAPKDVIQAIDGRLLWLAQDSGRIDSQARWDRWSDAVAALRFRGSHDLGRFLHKQLKSEKDTDILAALEQAQSGLAKR